MLTNQAPTGVDLISNDSLQVVTTIEETVIEIPRKVAFISVTDDDYGVNNITLSGDDVDRFFVSNSILYLNASVTLDFETKNIYAVTIEVKDSSITDSSAVTTNYTLNVTDVNEAPVITSEDTVSVDENADIATSIYTTAASDEDANDTITFSLSGTDATAFCIDEVSGEVTLNASADFETKQSYSINVVATDDDGLTDTKAVTINVTDVNEAPVITSEDTVSVDENADIKSIYTAAASDEDANDTITFSLSGTDATAFSIDEDTGEVTLNPTAENYEVKVKYSIVVVAADNQGLTAEKTVTINLTHSVEDDIKVSENISIEEFIQPSNYSAKDQIAAILNGDESLSEDDKSIILESFDLHFADENGQPSVKLLTIDQSADSIEIDGSEADDNTVLIVDASSLLEGTKLNFNNISYAIIIGPVHLEGGAGANIIIADKNPQLIVLGEEDDNLNGGAGDDVIGSHGGNDTLIGGEGDDTIFGGDGDDSIIGGTGNDILYGEYGPENEACDLLSNTDLCYDEAMGDDTIEGGAGNDTIYGGSGTDTVVFLGNLSDYVITFNEEDDTYVVKDIRDESPDGTNTVTQVEYFDFNDVDVDVTTFSRDALEQAVAASSDGSSGDGLGTFLAGLATVVGTVLFVI